MDIIVFSDDKEIVKIGVDFIENIRKEVYKIHKTIFNKNFLITKHEKHVRIYSKIGIEILDKMKNNLIFYRIYENLGNYYNNVVIVNFESYIGLNFLRVIYDIF